MGERIYVGGLGPDTTDERLLEMFRPFGAQAVQVARAAKDGPCTGSAEVVVGDRAQAEAACRALNGRECSGRLLTVHLPAERRWDVYRTRRRAGRQDRSDTPATAEARH
ncbi:RNA-binding protein [uncultured Pseudacidovorax sp.]|uniref:RNA recognition motif domain-containing protein n=1 Tax=uncultured Pseudacidovorax sp. TaxID=679313 RepID=UPI0025F46DEA|nr:RNA-binding protein [uncultured Pseudacidovorax sp.]